MVCCHPTRMESCRSCDRTVVYAWNKRSRFRLPWNWNKLKNFCLRAEAYLLWGCDLPHLIHQGPFAFFCYVRCIVTPLQRMSIYDDVSYQYLSIFHACKKTSHSSYMWGRPAEMSGGTMPHSCRSFRTFLGPWGPWCLGDSLPRHELKIAKIC